MSNIERLLVQSRLVNEAQLTDLRASRGAARIDRAAIDSGVISEDHWLEFLGKRFGIPVIDLRQITPDPQTLALFPTRTVFHYEVLPLHRENGHVAVAVSDPFDIGSLDELSTVSGLAVKPVLARRREIADRIKELLGMGGDTINEMVRLQEEEGEADLLKGLDYEAGELAESAQAPSVIRLVNELLVEAVEQKASDVHVEPHEGGLTIRFRVDGMLSIQPVPSEIHQFAAAIVTRLKIMSRLNIAEKRLPQDGRIKLRVAGREIDLRVSIIPMIYGEGVVLRLLDKQRMVFNLKNVGMPPALNDQFQELIHLPHGIVLVTGPTGSGKSTTLYSALSEIKGPSIKIITVEDPVEYHSPGISQIQVHSRIGLTFAAGLRSILRHDPDVILIGEIRDGETAESAIQAALTGHLVFSTLHTNDAPGSMTRLIDMGVEPYLAASTVEGVLAQRLVRKLCKVCRVPMEVHPETMPVDFPIDRIDGPIYESRGCRECRETGYSGRIGIFELMISDDTIRDLTIHQASAGELRKHATARGMMSLRQCGYDRVLNGVTSLEEVSRVTKGDLS